MKKSVILWVGWLLAFLWIGNADIWAQDAGRGRICSESKKRGGSARTGNISYWLYQ